MGLFDSQRRTAKREYVKEIQYLFDKLYSEQQIKTRIKVSTPIVGNKSGDDWDEEVNHEFNTTFEIKTIGWASESDIKNIKDTIEKEILTKENAIRLRYSKISHVEFVYNSLYTSYCLYQYAKKK